MPKPTKMLARKKGKLIECLACRRYCNIPNGEAGFCGVRTNENGKLKLLVHSKPCAVWIDPIEKKPFFHFLPGSKAYSIGTFGCDFACEFCQNWDISQAPAEARKNNPKGWKAYFERLLERSEQLPPEKVVENALIGGCKSIAFTYNEPTIFTEYAIDVMKIAHKKGLKGVYVTNGYESEECWDAISKYINAANIDLKAFNQNFYGKLCKANLEGVMESIKYVKKKHKKMWIEITTLLVPGENDNEEELRAEAEWLAKIDKEMPWHITAFHPDYKMMDKEPTSSESLIKAREIAKKAGLKHVYTGNVPFSNSNYEATICPKCKKEIIKRTGFYVNEINIIDGKCRFCNEKIDGVWR
ncbi:MAG: AmmeMemoRadiSam system radical SAM enzyme [Candidatus Micrarchaeia archaeon]|jgi:pyruvate formate lyase activating enzyme